MEPRVHYSAPALSVAASGKRLPTWQLTVAYLTACEISDPIGLARWQKRWADANTAMRAGRRRSPPAPDLSGPVVLPTLTVRYVDTDPTTLHSIDEFCIAMDQMRVEAGLSFRGVADRSRQVTLPTPFGGAQQLLNRNQVADMLNGNRTRLTRTAVTVYLAVCGMTTERIPAWLRVLQRLKQQEQRAVAAFNALSGHDTTLDEITRHLPHQNPAPPATKNPRMATSPREPTTDHIGNHRPPPGRLKRLIGQMFRRHPK